MMNRFPLLSRVTALAAACLCAPLMASAQAPAHAPAQAAAPAATAPAVVPFGPAKNLTTSPRLAVPRSAPGAWRSSTTTVQGHPTYHALFTVKGGFLMFKVDDELESWFDVNTLSSRRFVQAINEVRYHTKRYYDIYPERAQMQQRGDTVKASVSDPLDDASFLYFVRTVPLEVGQTYTFNRYFRPDRNPVIVKVLRREQVTVPAGTFNTVVIQPIIKSGGLFAEGGEAEMWLTDDSRRMMVQFKAKIPVLQSLDLYLTSFRPPNTEAASTEQRRARLIFQPFAPSRSPGARTR